MAVCGGDGQIRARDHDGRARADGVFHRDQRILSEAVLTADGLPPEPLGHRMIGADRARFTAILRGAHDATPDPELVLERTRDAEGGESLRLRNSGTRVRALTLTLTVAADLADVAAVRAGRCIRALEPRCTAAAVTWSSAAGLRISLVPAGARPATVVPQADGCACISWEVRIAPRETWQTSWTLQVEDETRTDHPVAPRSRDKCWDQPRIADDPALDRFVQQGLADLGSLLLADPREEGVCDAVFAAAGAPWYLTLFGRDSLWTARMMLPLGTRLAAGTLLALARRQGTRHEAGAEQAPGKILHELRRGPTRHQYGLELPALYYGSIDATALFVLLYCEAVDAGLDVRLAVQLLPHVRAALGWMLEQGGAGDHRWLRYEPKNPAALSNHGWKDSQDAIVANRPGAAPVAGPVTLVEVQAYAYEAIHRFTALACAHPWLARGEGVDPRLAEWAAFLKRDFHKTFYHDGHYVMALAGDGEPVTGLTSNMGHLLGTGILDDEQSAAVAALLGSDELDSGWGLRTRAYGHSHFNPLGYHSGAVWAHDTAIAIRGLSKAATQAAARRSAHTDALVATARGLLRGLIDAAVAFDYRLPELYAGHQREPGDRTPLPYPAACRPQAWAAASAVAAWDAVERLRAGGLW
jgi:glycogen debranching enzyme